jgi:hypothetical protein
MLRRYVFFCPSTSDDVERAIAAAASIGARAVAAGSDKVIADLHGEQLEALVMRLSGWDYLPDRRKAGRANSSRVMGRGGALCASAAPLP